MQRSIDRGVVAAIQRDTRAHHDVLAFGPDAAKAVEKVRAAATVEPPFLMTTWAVSKASSTSRIRRCAIAR